MQLLYEIKQDPGLAETKRWANTIVAKYPKSLDYNDDGAVAQNAQKLLAMPFGLLANSNFRSAGSSHLQAKSSCEPWECR